MCTALCKGGPVYYKVREESGITNEWIYEYVVPRTQSQYCESVSLVVRKALLWVIFDPEERSKVSAFITNSVVEAYGGSLNNRLDGEVNPV